MSYAPYSSAHYSPPSHASSVSSLSGSIYGSSGRRKSPRQRWADIALDSTIAARYEAAKSFDLEDDLEFCPSLTIDEVCFPSIYRVQLTLSGASVLRRYHGKIHVLSRVPPTIFSTLTIFHTVSPKYLYPPFPSALWSGPSGYR
jgi:hypothetical protein